MTETTAQFKARLGIGHPCTALRRTGGPGTTRTTPVPNDNAPGLAGTTTDHWDGRRDATATVTIHRNPHLKVTPCP